MFTFTLTDTDDSTLEVRADSRDVYVWEQTGGKADPGRSLKRLLEQLRISDLYGVAWPAWRRATGEALPLEDFARRFALDFEEDDAEEPDPTQPAASAGGS